MSVVLVFLMLAEITNTASLREIWYRFLLRYGGIYVILMSLCTSVCIVKYILSFFFF